MRKARSPDWRLVGWPYRALYTLVEPWHNRLVLRARGLDLVPRAGGVVLATNHYTNWDPCLLQLSLPRPVLYLGKQEVFRGVGKWFFPRVGVIPVDRSRRNPEALAAAREKLEQGAIIGIFPEGTRQPPGATLGEAKPGAAKLALQAGVPVLPAGLASDRFWPRGTAAPKLTQRVYVSFGEPLRLKGDAGSADDVARATHDIMSAIRRELDAAKRARDAGEAWERP